MADLKNLTLDWNQLKTLLDAARNAENRAEAIARLEQFLEGSVVE